MAIYHLTAKTVSRGESTSAAVRSDYIERVGRYRNDEAEVLHKAHGNMPAWAEDCPRQYWEATDAYERANGRLFKQLEFALPKELSPEQQVQLAASFCEALTQTKDGPLPYSFALHKGHDKENPHCHLLISERVNDGHSREPGLWFKRAAKDPAKGGARKTNELRPREWLLHCRELWAERANLALQHAGHEARIDHRTLEAQGIERTLTTHLGPRIAAMERKGIRTERGDSVHRRTEISPPQRPAPIFTPGNAKPVVEAPPTVEECHTALLAIAKQERYKVESHYQEQIKPYLEYFADAEDKTAAFAFCQERMQEDVGTGTARLKEMSRELSERLRRFGGSGSQQSALRQEAMDHIRTAPDREEAFADVVRGMDMALERSRERGLGR